MSPSGGKSLVFRLKRLRKRGSFKRVGVRHCESVFRSNPVNNRILDCFASLAMTNEREGRRDERENGRKENNAYLFTRSLVYSSTDNTSLSSLRGTKPSRTMKHKMAYNDKGCMSLLTGILDCFATLAMTNGREGRRYESANGRMENNAYMFTRSLVYSFTENTTQSSLRGTKQSRIMKHKRAYNDKGCKSIRVGILDCFASLAMTNEGEGAKGRMVQKGRKDKRDKWDEWDKWDKRDKRDKWDEWGRMGRKENNAYLFTRSLVYSFTDCTTLSSLRGTKQSRIMKHKRAYNDKGWKSILTGILDCFASLAMTK
jgi:hypothetical protein